MNVFPRVGNHFFSYYHTLNIQLLKEPKTMEMKMIQFVQFVEILPIMNDSSRDPEMKENCNFGGKKIRSINFFL